jgi:hypothetical protein
MASPQIDVVAAMNRLIDLYPLSIVPNPILRITLSAEYLQIRTYHQHKSGTQVVSIQAT